MKFRFGNPQRKLEKKLVAAARTGDVKQVASLLDQGANVNTEVSPGGPPLFAAAYGGNSDSHLQVIEMLLAHGATVDARNGVKCTALMGAANRGHVAAVKRLLAAGADRELRGRNNNNTLDWAMMSGKPEMIMFFHEKQPEPVVENPQDVVFRRPMGNRVLEEVFDFSARERITLIRKGEDGPVEAVTRDGFASIEDRGRLREAFDAYVKRGGVASEEEVFSECLAKPRAPRKGL